MWAVIKEAPDVIDIELSVTNVLSFAIQTIWFRL